MDLASFRVPCSTDEIFYIPNFVSTDEEQYLLRKISDLTTLQWKVLPNRRLQVWGGELTPSGALIPQELPGFITNYPDIIKRLHAMGVFSSSKHRQPNHVIVNEYQPGQGIMPHEDGPTYHPVVATLSLGSHTVLNYHRYVDDHQPSVSGSPTSQPASGRAIAPTPLLTLLLESRSLVITAGALYTRHLHSIEPLTCDVFAPAIDLERDHSGARPRAGVKVANWEMLTGERERRAATEGGVLARGTRVSLTCRDVERVVGGGKALGKTVVKW